MGSSLPCTAFRGTLGLRHGLPTTWAEVRRAPYLRQTWAEVGYVAP